MAYILTLQSNIVQTRARYFDIDPESRCHKSSPEHWSKREIIGHLIDSARYNLIRFEAILLSDAIYKVIGYNQNSLVRMHNYQGQRDEDILTTWQIVNKQIIAIWTKIKDADLQKTILVNEEITTLQWLINDYLIHMKHHLDQVFSSSTIYNPVPIQVTLAAAAESLATTYIADKTPFVSVMSYGGLKIEYYKPDTIDRQSPHLKDEVYVIASGSGQFICDGHITTFNANDILFVKAGIEHRFFDFTDDFSTWVIFYGLCVD